jgi:hypothetical protein
MDGGPLLEAVNERVPAGFTTGIFIEFRFYKMDRIRMRMSYATRFVPRFRCISRHRCFARIRTSRPA